MGKDKPLAVGFFTRTTSAVFLSDDVPQEIAARWLRPAQKQGPVLVLISPAYTSTKFTLIVFPQGLSTDAGEGTSFVQNFYQGGVGGGKILQNFGVDASGTMTVITQTLLYGKLQSTVVSRWNGYEFKP